MYFPTPVIPYILSWIPFGLALTAQSIFFSRRYRPFVASDKIRFLTCLALALNPYGQFHLMAHTDYSIWNCLLVLIFLSIVRIPDQHWLAYFLVYNVLIWGHPLAIVVLPFALYFAITEKTLHHRYLYGIVIVHLLLHQILGIKGIHFPQIKESLRQLHGLLLSFDGSSLFSQLWQGAVLWGKIGSVLFQNVFLSVSYMLQHVMFRTLWGDDIFSLLAKYRGLSVASLFSGGLLFLIYRQHRQRGHWKVLLVSGYFMGIVSYLSLCSRGMDIFALTTGHQLLSPRYIYIQGTFFLILLFSSFSQVSEMTAFSAWKNIAGRSGGMRGAFLGIVCCLLLNGIPNNLWHYHPASPYNGQLVKDFARYLHHLEQVQGTRKNIVSRLDKIDDWPILIDTSPVTIP